MAWPHGLLVIREVCEVHPTPPPKFSMFYLAFTEREQVITPGQHVFDTRNDGCPHADESGEISYLVALGALQRGGFALFLGTVYEDLISMPTCLLFQLKNHSGVLAENRLP